MNLDNWLLYAGTLILVSLAPGPSVLLALQQGRRAGSRLALFGALGNTAAGQIQALISILGLGAVLAVSREWFTAIKLLGAIYLCYLGLKLLLRSGADAQEPQGATGPRNATGLFVQAFLVTLSNPKSILFFVALFPQFIVAGGNGSQYLILLLTMAAIAFASFWLYACGGGWLGRALQSPRWVRAFDAAVGSVFVGLGISLAWMKNA